MLIINVKVVPSGYGTDRKVGSGEGFVEQPAPAGRPLGQLTTDSKSSIPKVSVVVIVIVVEAELPAVTVTVPGEGEILTEVVAPTGFTNPTKHTRINPTTNRKRLFNNTQPK